MEWPNVHLKDTSVIIMGQSPPGDSYNEIGKGLPFFQGKAEFGTVSPTVRKWCTKPSRIAEAGDILLSVRAPVGPTNVAVEQCCIGRGLAAIRANYRLLNQQYLGFYLKYQEPSISIRGQGSTFAAINRAEVEDLLLPLPPLSEQRRIAEILDRADTLRRKHAEADAKVERVLSALFNKMFGDPGTNPMGWDDAALHQVVDIVGGGTPSKSVPEFWKGSIPWVSPKDMRRTIIMETEDHISKVAVANSATNLIPRNSVLIVFRSGILAHTVPIAIAGTELTLNQDMKALIPKTDELESFYLLAWMLSSKQILLSCVKKGATVQSIDGSKFRTLRIALPPPDRQHEFTAMFQKLLRDQEQRAGRKEGLDILFANLLHRAFSGDLTAGWREGHIQELLQEMEEQARLLGQRTTVEQVALL